MHISLELRHILSRLEGFRRVFLVVVLRAAVA
jgi:hypothetical protein